MISQQWIADRRNIKRSNISPIAEQKSREKFFHPSSRVMIMSLSKKIQENTIQILFLIRVE